MSVWFRVKNKMKILICGSGFSVEQTDDWDLSTHTVVAVNNAHGRVKWNYFSCTEDYEVEFNPSIGFPSNLVPVNFQDINRSGNWFNQDAMMHAVRQCGDWNDCGHSVVIATAYCALTYFKDTIESIGFIGADMVYSSDSGSTAFYGKGIDFEKRNMADPIAMARFHRLYHNRTVNTYYNKPWYSLTDEEIITYFYKRLESYAYNTYSVKLVNYSIQQHSLLPYEYQTYI